MSRPDHEESGTTIETPQGSFRVRYVNGLLTAGPYRGVDIEGHSVAEIRQRLEEADTFAATKRALVKRREELGRHPIPALLTHTLEQVQVRGVNSRTGTVLITRVGGQKDSVGPRSVLRALDDKELAQLQSRWSEAEAVRAAIPDGASLEDAANEVGQVHVNYDFKADQYVATLRGTVLRGSDEGAVEAEIQRRAIAATYPFYVEQGAISRVLDALPGYLPHGRVFKTAADAQAYIEADARSRQATRAAKDLEARYLFDLSVFSEQD